MADETSAVARRCCVHAKNWGCANLPSTSRGFRFSIRQYTIVFMSKFFQFTVFFGFFWVVGFLYAITNLLGGIHETQKQMREELARIRANQT